MSLRQALAPKEPRNLTVTAVACALVFVGYAIASSLGPWSPKRGLGLVFGILAALFFVFEMLYPVRRPRARPLGTAKAWLQAHVYLGAVAFIGVLAHSDFSWPHGAMGWWLLSLSAWTTGTGLLGVWLQKWVPVALSDGLRVEALYERIPALVEGLRVEADALMTEASDPLERFYQGEVRNALGRPQASWSYLFDVRSGRERALEPFRRIGQFVSAEERDKVEDLMQIYTDKLELDAQYSLQGVLRRWLLLHVPPAGLLMGLLVIHVATWVLY
jgi:hypothetical protein